MRIISLHFTAEDTQNADDCECVVDIETKSVKNVRAIIPTILRKAAELAVKKLGEEVKIKDVTYCR